MSRRNLLLSLVAFALALAVSSGCGGASSSTPNASGGSSPVIGMRLDALKPPDAAKIAQAAEGAHAGGVGLDLYWGDIEPKRPTADGKHTYRWGSSGFEQTVNAMRSAGVNVLTVRVRAAPDWAVKGKSCKYKACPPLPAYYDDFRKFVAAAVGRYGPGGTNNTDIQHWSLWNEPNKTIEWGGEGGHTGTYKQYSNLLVGFHAAVERAAASNGAKDEVSVDAGELAAGGAKGDNAPRGWVAAFERYNKAQGRDGDFDLLTIHAYSQDPRGVTAKLLNYQRLFKGHQVAVTEFGWSVGGPRHGGNWKCVPNEGAQAAKFTHTVDAVKKDPRLENVPWLVWFVGVDEDFGVDAHAKTPKCPVKTWYRPRVRPSMNAFGLYERARNGSGFDLHPRKVVDAFSAAAERGGGGG